MKTSKKNLLFLGCVSLLLLLGCWRIAERYWLPTFPDVNRLAPAPFETRKYDAFVIPREDADWRAIRDRAFWRVNQPGQVRLINVAAASNASGLQEALDALGYQFPPGASARSGDVVPGWTIHHHPLVLDHLERYLDLTPKSAIVTPKP